MIEQQMNDFVKNYPDELYLFIYFCKTNLNDLIVILLIKI